LSYFRQSVHADNDTFEFNASHPKSKILASKIAMSPRCAIAISHVNKAYSNGTVALQDLNLTVGEAEFISLVGPSGCGKSTALRLIAGLGKMNSGSIVLGEGHKKPELAFVFQEAALMPGQMWSKMSVCPLKLAGVPKRESRATVQEALNLVGLAGFERSYPRELSGGMKMRVSIARALVTKPKYHADG
jgi:NitT/TauT family transport system ATP-binding protein